MGLSAAQMLWRVEVPLALPSIIAGIRIAVVTTVSLATIAAFVVPEGLGNPITIALQRRLQDRDFAAGGLAVALALVSDALLVLAQRVFTPWARVTRDDPRSTPSSRARSSTRFASSATTGG